MLIEKIKSQISCIEYAESQGALWLAGNKHHFKYEGCSDGSSAYIYPETNSWYCFRHAVGGDIIDLAEFIRYGSVGRHVREVVSLLREQLGITLRSGITEVTESELLQIRASGVFRELVSFAEKSLWACDAAQTMLLQRGISRETLKRFRAGFLSPANGLTSYDHLISKGYDKETLKACGLIGSDGTYCFQFGSSCLFPVFLGGKIVNIVSYRPNQAPVPKYMHLSSASCVQFVPFGMDTIPERPDASVFLCEGIFDALSAYESGFACVARLGTRFSQSGYREFLQACENSTVMVVTDYDKATSAGREAAVRDIQKLLYHRVATYLVDLTPSLFNTRECGKDGHQTAVLSTAMSVEDCAKVFGLKPQQMTTTLINNGIAINEGFVDGYNAVTTLMQRGIHPMQRVTLDGMLSEFAKNLPEDASLIKKLDLNYIWTVVGKSPRVIQSLAEHAIPAIRVLLEAVSPVGKTRDQYLDLLRKVIERYPDVSKQSVREALQYLGFANSDITQLTKQQDESCDKPVLYAQRLMDIHKFVYHDSCGTMLYNEADGIWSTRSEAYWNHLLRRVVPKGQSIANMFRFVTPEIQGSCYSIRDVFAEKQTRYIVLANGVFDTFTGQFIDDFSPSYYATSKLNIMYNETATCPIFDRFLYDIFVCPREEANAEHLAEAQNKAEYVKELLGLLMVPDNSLQMFWTFIGAGGNGKSTLQNIIIALLGEKNVSSVSLSQFGNRFSMVNLIGKLANISSEKEASPTSDIVESVKRIVGGEPSFVEAKYEQGRMATIYARIIISANQPIRWPVGDAMERRQRNGILTFPNRFSDTVEEPNGNMRPIVRDMERLVISEASGIFNAAMRGLKELRHRGRVRDLAEGNEILQAEQTATAVAEFAEMAIEKIEGKTVHLEDFHKRYMEWRQNMNRKAPYFGNHYGKFKAQLQAWCDANGVELDKDRTVGVRGAPPVILKDAMLLSPFEIKAKMMDKQWETE